MKNFGKKGFEKAFAKAVPNFDETKIFFSHPSRSHEESTINIVWQGKLWKFKIYRTDYHLNIWKNHFIDFLNTGEFDYNGYWRKYKGAGEDNFVGNEVYKLPLCKRFGNDFYEHSPEMDKFLRGPYGKGVGQQYGIRTVPKPMENELDNIKLISYE